MNIIIVMSTFNGSAYIDEQIQSIRNQTIDSWQLIIRDDASTDGTAGIIQDFMHSDKRISIIEDSLGNLGPAKSFNVLANQAASRNADYLMFSDQDDYWEPWKIQRTLEIMQRTESHHPGGTPVLVHTDLEVVDSGLSLISTSYLSHQNMHDAGKRALHVLLSQNYITGCTIMANRPLISIAQPIPENIIMHDWWYGLCAATTGVIAFDETPSIRYRQHTANVYGSAGFVRMLFSVRQILFYLSRKKSNYLDSYAQDLNLRARLSTTEYCDSEQFRLLDEYVSFGNKPGVVRALLALTSGIFQQGMLRNLFFYVLLLFINPSRKTEANGEVNLGRE